MEKIKVDVQWCDKNFGAALGDNVPGAVVLTAKSYEELLREVPETLRFILINYFHFREILQKSVSGTQFFSSVFG